MNGTYSGPDIIEPGTHMLMTSEQVWAEIRRLEGSYHADSVPSEEEMSDAAALTVCSWFMSPGWDGRAFSELVHTGRVGLEALADDLSRAFDSCDQSREGRFNNNALGYVATWALNHPSRHTPAAEQD